MSSLLKNIRVLPLVIFLSTLTLTIRIGNVFDAVRTYSLPHMGINELQAAEKSTPEAEALSSVLQASDYKNVDAQSKEEKGESVLSSFTQSEIQILQELAERREALDIRSQEIDKRAVQLKVSEKEIENRLKQMQVYEEKLKTLIQEYNSKEKEKILSLVKVYANMKPKDAARIFDTLDLEVSVALLKEMKPSTSSAILAQMAPVKAKAITDEIIGNAF